ncbi:MAG: hypothetical protein JSU74_14065 [Candidatus Zixiibacteriota bacterium]|nr:MAG: hypothetical protein JSU74_14065 [candidate division Zixibacteria bacterium]
MTRQTLAVTLLLIILVLTMVAAVLMYELPFDTRLWIEIQNAGHTPIFGIVSLLVLGISSRLLGTVFSKRLVHYLVALVVTALLGLFSEYAQIDGPRDADIMDFLRDIAGIVSFLGVSVCVDRKVNLRAGKLRGIILTVAILSFIATMVPVAYWSTVYLGRNATFPVICDFDSYWGKRFVGTNNAALSIVRAPRDITDDTTSVGQVTFGGDDYPGLEILEPYPDWRGYRQVSFEVLSPEDSSVHLSVRIEDQSHNGEFEDRFNRTVLVKSGMNKISFGLADIRSAPSTREIDLASMGAIHIFAARRDSGLTLYFDNIRLE